MDEDRKTSVDKQIGDTIYEHLTDLQVLLERFAATWRKGGDLHSVFSLVKAAKQAGNPAESLFESFDSRNLAVNVRVGEFSFSLSLRKSIYENAAEFYDRGKRAKQKWKASCPRWKIPKRNWLISKNS